MKSRIPEKMIEKMIAFYKGDLHDIEHFIKVHAYARMIGKMEGLDDETQELLEQAAIVHDIACPLCREKYGSCRGADQETESAGLLRPFLAEFALGTAREERIITLVSHHHTYYPILGKDHQILLEADFLVNAGAQNMPREQIEHFYNTTAKTASGRHLLKEIYLR